MNKLKKMLVTLLMVAVFMKTANAVQCYNCDSSINPDCHDLKNGEIEPVTCTFDKIGENIGELLKKIITIDIYGREAQLKVPMQCQKFVATNENDEKVTFRGCQLNLERLDICEYFTMRAEIEQGVNITECELCHTDNCNESTGLRCPKLSFFLLYSVFLFYSYFIRE